MDQLLKQDFEYLHMLKHTPVTLQNFKFFPFEQFFQIAQRRLLNHSGMSGIESV